MTYAVNTVVEINNKRYIASKEDVLFSCQGCVFDNPNKSSECTKLNYYGEGCSGREGACSIIWKPLVKVDEKPLQTTDNDVVNKPKHYMLFEDKNIEVRDLMKLLADRLQSKGYSAMFISDYIQMMQYVLRFDQKNAEEDLAKAAWYLDKLLISYEENSAKVPE